MSANSFLNDNDLVELTGYVQKNSQRRWLQRQGIVHYINAKGQVKVAWFNVTHPTWTIANQDVSEPDFGIFDGPTSH
ncbi:DUF4224 domain-containing protein [Oceanobacter mangrovi]|uniref:DUF4224 domain-containing protein n=1 Tax=Oceanobacter mangrovi TaxID=2862510 RepID=UPI001C8DF56F|nr:DUF4224 domain-containing protein [Oceanobacter mangrovi]